MSAIDYEHAIYLINEAKSLQTDKSIIKVLNDALTDISGDKEGECEQVEMEIIDTYVDNQEGLNPTWSGVATPQEMTVSTSVERESPKRNPKTAANALAKAEYKCEYNTNDRIFERKSGKGYTEPHHLIPISKYRDFDYNKPQERIERLNKVECLLSEVRYKIAEEIGEEGLNFIRQCFQNRDYKAMDRLSGSKSHKNAYLHP